MKKLIIVFVIVVFLSLATGGIYYFFGKPLPSEQNPPEAQTPENQTPGDQNSETKTYRNEEWGFEFRYPENWSFQVNKFRSQSSKFELLGDTSAENYNPFSPLFIIHIVTPDFANRAFSDLRDTASEVSVGGVTGLRYEYEFEGISRIAIDLPSGEYRMLLGANQDNEDIFNKILASFKFLK